MKRPQTLDITCNDCSKKAHCKTPCVFIDKLAGKGKALRERLAPLVVLEHIAVNHETHSRVLADIIEAKRKRSISDVRNIPCIKKRAIAALLYANIKPYEMADLLIMAERTIYRHINGK